jgi:hypothetical protein
MNKGTVSLILGIVGCVGVVATTVMAIYETPEAIKRMDDHRLDVDPSGESDLSWQEKAIDYVKGYPRTIITGSVTIAANVTSLILTHRTIKEFATVAGIGAAIGGRYKDKAAEIFGAEKAKILDNAVKKELKDDEFMTKKVWFQEPVSGIFFQSTWKDIYEAEYEANKKIATEGYVCIGELFPEIEKKAPKTAEWLWCQDQLLEDYGYPWLDFVHQRKNCYASEDGGVDYKFNDGRETYVINYGIYPMPHNLAIECGYESPY